MGKNKNLIEYALAVLSVLLVAVVATIKLTNKDLYGTSATSFQTARMALYAVGAVCAAAGLVVFALRGFKSKAGADALPYGLAAIACLCMAAVQGLSIAGEFENQGKTLQDAMFAVVYLMLAATMYILCAMESPKRIFRVIVAAASLILFLAAAGTDWGYLMAKAGRITSETAGAAAFALYGDKVAVLLAGLAALVHEIVGFAENKPAKTKEGEE